MSADERVRWLAAAERIATGIVDLAHVEAFVDPSRLRVGFFCYGDAALPAAYERAILKENIEGRCVDVTEQPRLGSGCHRGEIILPCRPDATDEEVIHAVLAVMKASHALEFEMVMVGDA
ncbi:MAG: hypothetical protein M3173_03725 [Chloroflexota bacterium]|nr:hypothetical protein [Chloroflexota bacterium]